MFSVYGQPATWNPRGIGGGGALFSPSINPADHNEYYIACDMSELFHTRNFGQSYAQVDFRQFSGGHNSKIAFTATAGLLYGISYVSDVGTPMKSLDNGITWTALAGNPDPTSDVWTLDADYNHPNRLVISLYGEIYFSNNGGTSFTRIHSATDAGAGNVVGGVFFDANNIDVGTNDGVLVSPDSGASWTTATIAGLPATERIWSFAAAKAGAVTRFFALTGDAANLYVGVQGSDYYGFMRGVYSCDYGSGGWVSKLNGITANDFPMFVGMAGNDINTVYLGGSNANSEPSLKKTVNAGTLWTETFNTTTNQNIITGWSGTGGDRGWSYGECPFGIAVAPNDPNVVVFGDFGFAHKTSNGGTTWQQAYVDSTQQHAAESNTPKLQSYASVGLENTSCWQMHWVNGANLFTGFSDIGGIRSADSGKTWSFNYTGNAANSTYRIAQGGNGTLYAATSGIHDLYQSTRLTDAILDAADANGRILYSTNGGQAWQPLHTFGHPVFWLALDPVNTNRVYASVIHYGGGTGTGGIYRCDDAQNLATSTWTLLPDPPRTEKHPASLAVLKDGKLVATFSGRRNTAGAFTASSGIFVYDPGAGTWSDVSDPGMHYWTKDVVIDPNDPAQNTWYVGVFSGWGGAPNGLGGLYKTVNRGTSGTFNPSNANQVFLTTETQGLWMSANINAASPTFSQVGNYPFRQPERVFFNPYNSDEMWVTSFGNGMKVGNLAGTSVGHQTSRLRFKAVGPDA